MPDEKPYNDPQRKQHPEPDVPVEEAWRGMKDLLDVQLPLSPASPKKFWRGGAFMLLLLLVGAGVFWLALKQHRSDKTSLPANKMQQHAGEQSFNRTTAADRSGSKTPAAIQPAQNLAKQPSGNPAAPPPSQQSADKIERQETSVGNEPHLSAETPLDGNRRNVKTEKSFVGKESKQALFKKANQNQGTAKYRNRVTNRLFQAPHNNTEDASQSLAQKQDEKHKKDRRQDASGIMKTIEETASPAIKKPAVAKGKTAVSIGDNDLQNKPAAKTTAGEMERIIFVNVGTQKRLAETALLHESRQRVVALPEGRWFAKTLRGNAFINYLPLPGFHYGLQWMVPVQGGAHYFTGTNAKKQPYALLIPRLWGSFRFGQGNEVLVQFDPYQSYVAPSPVLFSHPDYIRGRDSNTIAATTAIHLIKTSGFSASVQYNRDLTPRWSMGVGFQYIWQQRALFHTVSIADTSRAVVMDTVHGGKRQKPIVGTSYIASGFGSGVAEVSYRFRRVQLGGNVYLPLSSLSPMKKTKPVNGAVFLRWRLR